MSKASIDSDGDPATEEENALGCYSGIYQGWRQASRVFPSSHRGQVLPKDQQIPY